MTIHDSIIPSAADEDLEVDLLIDRADLMLAIATNLVGTVPDSSDAFEPWQSFAYELQDAKRARSRGDLITAWTHASLAVTLGEEASKLIR